jgi:DNA-binding CsgD family transcriptional regulator
MFGRYEDVVRVSETGEALAEGWGLARTSGAFIRANRAEALLRLGRWEEAVAAAAPGTAPPGVFTGALLLVRAEVYLLSGRRAEAESELREARRQLKHVTAPQFAFPLAWIGAQAARADGDLDGARDLLAGELTRADAGEDPRYRWPLLALAMTIEADRVQAARDRGAGPPADAMERAAALHGEADAMTPGTQPDHGQLALLRAEHARLAAAGEAAAWEAAVAAWRRTSEPYPLAVALFRRAEALAAEDAAGAAAAADEAAEIARRLGAAPLLAEVEALVRRGRLHVDAAADDEAPDLGLTARELEVLRLVADGHSNGAIAEQLFISPKTASVHVSNILGKLGVATRVQAAAVAHRRGLTRV